MTTRQNNDAEKSRKRKLHQEDEKDEEDVEAPPQRKTKESQDRSPEKKRVIEISKTEPVRENQPISPQPHQEIVSQSKTAIASTTVKEATIPSIPSKESTSTRTTSIAPPPRMSRLQQSNDTKVKAKSRDIDHNKTKTGPSISAPTAVRVEEDSVRARVEPTADPRSSWLIWGIGLHLFFFVAGQNLLAKSTVSLYKSLRGGIIASSVKVENDLNHFESEARIKMEKEIRLLDFNKDRLQKSRATLLQDILPIHKGLTLRVSEMNVFQKNVSLWLDSVEQATHTIETSISQNEKLLSSPIMIATIKDLLGKEASEQYLLDLQHVALWNIDAGLAHCEQALPLTSGRAFDVQRQLFRELQDAATLLTLDEGAKRAVTQWFLEDTIDRFTRPITLPGYSDVNEDTIRKIIHDRMEVVSADFTGKVDYAAIPKGGVVITTGPYATTPSLLETLPACNRMLQYLNLRFYGHGPEAAIMPTFPLQQSKALGQCWSFTAAPSNYRKSVSGYAVLSLRLAQLIFATQVSIEHPPQEINDHAKAAIRSFRIVGFESDDATGKAWEMGRFEYRLEDGPFLQFFDLSKEEVGGAAIPAIQSLSLLIDSNWGMMYSCLYRFRVHGEAIDNEKQL